MTAALPLPLPPAAVGEVVVVVVVVEDTVANRAATRCKLAASRGTRVSHTCTFTTAGRGALPEIQGAETATRVTLLLSP